MAIELPPLPYPEDALEPHISRETLQYHYGKHHRGYVDALNEAIEGTEQADYSLEKLVATTEGAVFNSAAQAWNHTFYWRCMSPAMDSKPGDKLQKAIEQKFGSLDTLREEFIEAAAGNFGSGWTWLVQDGAGKLDLLNTSDADTPVRRADLKPLLTVDVWEHAYYIDYRNERGDYLDAFWKLIDWEFVAKNLESSAGQPSRDQSNAA